MEVEKKFPSARSVHAEKMTSLDFWLPLAIMRTMDRFAIKDFSKPGEVYMRYKSVSIRFLCGHILFDFSVDL